MRLNMFVIKMVDLNKMLISLLRKDNAVKPALVPRSLLFYGYCVKTSTPLPPLSAEVRNAYNPTCQGLMLKHRSTVILDTSYTSFIHAACEVMNAKR